VSPFMLEARTLSAPRPYASVAPRITTHGAELRNGIEPAAITPRGKRSRPERPSTTPLIRNWCRLLPYIGGIAALLLFAAALVVLHSHAQEYRPSEVRRALRSPQAWQPFAALGLAAASYLLLTLYDVLALRHIGRTLPYRRVALASITGYAFSHTLGFGSLIGPSIRTEFTRLWG
jgi:uncharacterized membrane protein YbhN (UPF0104 family)